MLTPENITRRIAVIVLMLLSVVAMEAKRVTPYSSSRIFWDIASRKTLFNNALYARMIELHDGRLMAVTGAGGYIVVSISNDKGTTWTPQQRLFTPPANYHYYDADLYQLKDGTIIICYNIGPIEPYDNVRRYGVRINRSTDNGKTWSTDTQIYTAGTDFHTGCWEPAILELPSGELHLYVSDESPFPDNYDQCIQLLRSTDKGKTWSATPETISYRPGTRRNADTCTHRRHHHRHHRRQRMARSCQLRARHPTINGRRELERHHRRPYKPATLTGDRLQLVPASIRRRSLHESPAMGRNGALKTSIS